MIAPVEPPETSYFHDDGTFPNSSLPVLVYRQVFTQTGEAAVITIQQQFAASGWANTWRWGVYPFQHYHSNTHEVLVVLSGNSLLLIGGESGKELTIRAGDVLIIPAGVAHKNVQQSADFEVLGAYPDGLIPDLNRGRPGERPDADKNIAAVALPAANPVTGKSGNLLAIWG